MQKMFETKLTTVYLSCLNRKTLKLKTGGYYECAEQSVLVLAGESPAWAKVNHQPNT